MLKFSTFKLASSSFRKTNTFNSSLSSKLKLGNFNSRLIFNSVPLLSDKKPAGGKHQQSQKPQQPQQPQKPQQSQKPGEGITRPQFVEFQKFFEEFASSKGSADQVMPENVISTLKKIKTDEERRFVVEDMNRFAQLYKTSGIKVFPPTKLSAQEQVKWLATGLQRGVFHTISRQFILDVFQTQGAEKVASSCQYLKSKIIEKPFKVVVTSAAPLDPFIKTTLSGMIRQSPLVSQEPQFHFETDPSLLGGFQILIGELLIDWTYKRSYQTLTQVAESVIDHKEKELTKLFNQIPVVKPVLQH